jgi:hypothetical protein
MKEPATRVEHMEHRWGRRIACGAAARLDAGAGIVGVGRLRDVSLSGAFIETALELPLLARVSVAVRDTYVAASVVRIVDDGCGVEWCETAPRAICPLLGCRSLCDAATDWK